MHCYLTSYPSQQLTNATHDAQESQAIAMATKQLVHFSRDFVFVHFLCFSLV
jgi:hypothetical protein